MGGLGSGWLTRSGEVGLVKFNDGKKDGLWTEWYENGQKKEEAHFKDGEEVED
jgi:antitoxin component YwqK of YwqJK toxin-antitoxin module